MGRVRKKTVKKVRVMYRCARRGGRTRWTVDDARDGWMARWMGKTLKDRDARDDDGGPRCRARGDG